MHDLWRQVGRPNKGVINDARIKTKLEYKLAIKQAADADRKQGIKLDDFLLQKLIQIFGNLGIRYLKNYPVMCVITLLGILILKI